jgi:hypothetical protein
MGDADVKQSGEEIATRSRDLFASRGLVWDGNDERRRERAVLR